MASLSYIFPYVSANIRSRRYLIPEVVCPFQLIDPERVRLAAPPDQDYVAEGVLIPNHIRPLRVPLT